MKRKIITATLILVTVALVIIGVYFSLEKNVKLITACVNFLRAYDPYLGEDYYYPIVEEDFGRPGYTTNAGSWNIKKDYWKLPIDNYWTEVPGTYYVQGEYWIPKDTEGGRQVYCLEPGAHINYYYEPGYSDSAVYYTTGYYDLPIAAAYIISAESGSNVSAWAEKQQALWNLRWNGLNNLYDSGRSSYGFIESYDTSEHDRRIKYI